jgi:hypothetical protein
MDRIQQLAETSVARGCGFAGLAIFAFMVGLSWDIVLAARAGGLLCLLVCMVLIVKALLSPGRPHQKTELWLMLDRQDRPPSSIAQRAISSALRECYWQFALHTACLAAALLASSICLQLLRHEILAERIHTLSLQGTI